MTEFFEVSCPGGARSLSDVMSALERAAVGHAIDLRIDHDRMLADYGCLWMVVRCRLVLSRLPEDVYLFANDSVLDFYPRFGFRKGTERQCVRAVEPAKAQAARTFDPMRPENRVRLERLLRLPRPGEALSLLDNPQLYLFYLLGPMSRCLYELPERAGLAVAGRQCRLPLAAAGRQCRQPPAAADSIDDHWPP